MLAFDYYIANFQSDTPSFVILSSHVQGRVEYASQG